MGRNGRTGAQAPQRRSHVGPAKRRGGRLCQGQGHEGALVSGDQPRRGDHSRDHNYYAKRWTIEPGFRDTKDLRFGMGMSVLRIADPQRRDRLFLLNAFAIVLLTLLGAAAESLGMDRHLKVNTAKRRTHSLFRQGCMLYELIPNMPEARLRPLIARFRELITQNKALTQTFAFV